MQLPYQLPEAEITWEGNTPRSSHYGDIYWYPDEALKEKSFVFLSAFRRQVSAVTNPAYITCAELGFGFGINCLLTCDYFAKHHPAQRLDYISIERHPVSGKDLVRLLDPIDLPFKEQLIARWPPGLVGTHVIWLAPNIRLLLIFNDVNPALAELNAAADVWYLDGFSPAKNEDMWADDLHRKMFARSRSGAVVATYSAAGRVRRGLTAAGFEVEKVPGYGRKQEMLLAAKPGQWRPATLHTPKVAVIGAGLAGQFCAEALQRRNLTPILVDNGRTKPSDVPQLSVFPQLALRPESRYRFSLLANQYMQDSPGYEASGVRFIPRTDEETTRLPRIADQFTNDIIEWQGNELYYRNAGWFSLEPFFEALALDPTTSDISELVRTADGWLMKNGDHQLPEVEMIILATGYDRRLTGAELEIRAVRGQAITAKTTGIEGVTTGPVSILPTWKGRSTIAGTYARSSDLAPSESDTEQLLSDAAGLLPAIDTDDVESYVGIRSASRDRLPVVDLMPDWQGNEDGVVEGIGICTAFGSRGATHARLCSEYLVSRMLGEALPLSASHQRMLSARRFSKRDRQRSYS